MAPDDFCRLCKVNMRESGPRVYAHSTDMFVTKTTPSISERLAMMELIVAPEPGQSNRCCQRCGFTLGRLEKDLLLFRQWKENVSKSQHEATPSDTPRTLKKTCPNPPSPRACSFGNTTTKVTINYPSQTLTRECQPEEDPIVKFTVLKRWKEAASHALKHRHLQEELKNGVLKLIRKECDVLCSRKYDFILWKSKPADLESFSFKRLRDDLHRLAPFLLSIFSCITNNNNLASCTAAAIAIRGRQPQLAALSYWINTVLQSSRVKKSVFSRLSKLSITTSHRKAVKKQQELALGCGADFVQFESSLKVTDTEESDGSESLEDLHLSEVQLQTVPTQTKEFDSSPSLDQQHSEIHQLQLEEDEVHIKQEEELGYTAVVVQISDEEEEERSSTFEFSSNDWFKMHDSAACSSTHNTVIGSNGENVSKNPQKIKKYICGECGKAFGWRATWRRHVATHSDMSPYTCSICSKRFPQKSHLVTHMVTHTGEKPFSCPECAARFSQKQNLVRHMNIHSGEKSFSCPFCGKLFSHKHSVQLHLMTHTGEKPFGCSLCDARFTKKPHLNRHMKCCHDGEKPYSCPVCQKSFTQRFDVQRHMKVHEKEADDLEQAARPESPETCQEHYVGCEDVTEENQ